MIADEAVEHLLHFAQSEGVVWSEPDRRFLNGLLVQIEAGRQVTQPQRYALVELIRKRCTWQR